MKKQAREQQGSKSNVQHALQILSSNFSDVEKILGGLYENHLLCKKTDTNYNNLNSISKSLTHYDILQQKIKSAQLFPLLAYQPFAIVNFHLKYATGGGFHDRIPY